jgi:hypothetical protein
VDLVALAQSQLVPSLFPWEYAATRARCAIDLRTSRNDDTTLRVFAMLPVDSLVSGPPLPFVLLIREALSRLEMFPVPLQIRAVNAARSDPPTPRSRAHTCAAQRREQERVVRRRERNMRRQERRKRRSEEFRLREQQGLSSLGTEDYSSSDKEEEEEEESDGVRLPPRGGRPRPPRPEPGRRWRRRRLGRALERPPPGN